MELLFDSMSYTDVVKGFRKVRLTIYLYCPTSSAHITRLQEHKGKLEQVLDLCRSHANLHTKNVLMLEVNSA